MNIPKSQGSSISEQIIQDLFTRLQESDVFSEVVLDKLRDIATNGKLTSSKSVIDAISTLEEQKNATN